MVALPVGVGVDRALGPGGIVGLDEAVVEGALQGVGLAGVGAGPLHARQVIGGVVGAHLAQLGEVDIAVFVVIPHESLDAVPGGHAALRGVEPVDELHALLGIHGVVADGPDAGIAAGAEAVNDGLGLRRNQGPHDGANLVPRIRHVLGGVVEVAAGIVKDREQAVALLHLGHHLVVGLGHGVRVHQAPLIELVEEFQRVEIGSVLLQTGVELASLAVVQTHADAVAVIAVVGAGQALDVHDHLAVPVGPDAHRVGGPAIVASGAEFLHLAQYVGEVVQVFDLGVAQLLIEVPTDAPVVDEGVVLALLVGDPVADAVDLAVGVDGLVGGDSVREVAGDVVTIGGEEILLVPVEEQALVHGGGVLLAVAAPDDDVAQVFALHTGLIGAVGVGDDGQLDVEFVL